MGKTRKPMQKLPTACKTSKYSPAMIHLTVMLMSNPIITACAGAYSTPKVIPKKAAAMGYATADKGSLAFFGEQCLIKYSIK